MYVCVCVSMCVSVEVVKINLDPTLADVQTMLLKRFTALIYHT